MSVKFEQPVYKLFEPGFHPQRPIIVDSGLESPETVTLQYEEAAARAHGGGSRGESPHGLLPMSAFKPHPPHLHGMGFGDGSFQHFQPQNSHHQSSQEHHDQHRHQSQQQQQPDPEQHKQQEGYSAAVHDDGANQLNSIAFEANSSAAPSYMTSASTATPGISVLSVSPTSGSGGARVQLKVWSQSDIVGMANPAPYLLVHFGGHKCPSQVAKESAGQDGFSYLVSVEAPDFAVTNWPSTHNVPLTLSVEMEDGAEIARVDNAGSFTYQSVQQSAVGGAVGTVPETATLTPGTSGMEVTCDPEAHADNTRSAPRSPARGDSPPQLTVRTSATTSPDQNHPQLPHDASTNTYDYPGVNAAAAAAAAAVDAQHQQQVQSNLEAVTYNQDATMMGSYHQPLGPQHLPHPHSQHRGSAYSGQHGRQSLRTQTWSAYGTSLSQDRFGGSRGPSGMPYSHTSLSRPTITPALPIPHSTPHSTTPPLRRTTTIQTGSPGAAHGTGMGSSGYNPWQIYPTKAILNINGNLDTMAKDWSPEEWANRRRIVLFKKKQTGNCLETTFRPVPVGDRPPNSICISCIWWAEKGECYVTSVDTISLLEQLVMPAPQKFPVEEKNRIRRNLEGFKPVTVSKAKADSTDFFTLIMAFGNPKPRNIEKDVKVFPWKILGQALKKIISKYSASPSSMMTASTPTLLTPTSISGSYSGLPPTPGSATTVTDHASANGYMSMVTAGRAADTVPSPRSLTGAPTWNSSFGTAGSARALSPGLKGIDSPHGSSSLTLAGLTSVYDTRGSHAAAAISNPYTLPGPSHASHHHLGQATMSATPSHSSHHDPKWDTYGLATGAGQYSTHQHAHGQIYGSGYGHGAQRA